ncbi:MAG: hypothetical protein H7A40_07495 [Chlamydiales bacterium]|nr:hypothetical protein [Chlamydiales bacterium]
MLHNKTAWISATLLVLFLLAGCATTYKKDSFFSLTGGYSDFATGPDTFLVSFNGNEFTSHERALKLAMMRASELTIQHGYSYYAILSESADSSKIVCADTYKESSRLTSKAYYTISSPCTKLRIKCFKEKPSDFEVIDAHFYLNHNTKS